jgi:excisionase family DNA binding protein
MTDAERRAKLRAAIDLLMDVLAVESSRGEAPTPTPTADPLLDAEDVAARLHLSVSTLYRLARSGTLPGVKLGAAWRFRASAVEAYVTAPARPSDNGLTG